jgi:hypothetical protein
MSLKILRWKGGFGGDIILRLAADSSTVHTNVKFKSSMSDQGRIQLDFSHLNLDNLQQIDRIALTQFYNSSIDPELLKQEFDHLIASDQSWWIKSHYYQQDFYKEQIVDIVIDNWLLPFAVAANINKTETLSTEFNPLVSKITDPFVQYQYSIYSIAKDFVCPYNTNHVLQLKQILSGWYELKHAMRQFNVDLDDRSRSIYENWLEINKEYFPTASYQQCLQTNNYNTDQSGLTLIEKYCLLVLSDCKFKLLEKNEI